jgi:hypothetical protein
MMAGLPISQLRLSTLATVPVRITHFNSKPPTPVADSVLKRDVHLG